MAGIRQPLSRHTFYNGFSATPIFAPEGSDASYLAPGSRNLLYLAGVMRPWKGMDSQGANSGIRTMLTVGSTWGGLADDGATQGKGSFFQDVSKSLWFIGAGTPEIESTPIASGVSASINLQVSIADNGVYDSSTTFEAGMSQPSPPDIGVISVPLSGTGLLTQPVAAKIARFRSSTGARSIASLSSAVVNPVNQSVRLTYPLPAEGQDFWPTFFNQPGFGGVGLYYRVPYNGSLDIPESLIGGTRQVETATVVGAITLSGNAKVVVTASGMTNSPKTIPVAVLITDTASIVAGKMRVVLAADTDVSAFFNVSGAGANIVLTAIDAAANDATMNIATDNDTCTGLTAEPTSANTTAGNAPATIDGIPRSLEFDFVAGDLVPEVAYIDDYPPPAGTNAVRLENVMVVLGCYGDSTASVSASDPGTVGAVSLPNFYESYPPTFLVYFPESIVDVLSRPTDSYAYVGHKNSITAMQYVGVVNGPAVQVNTISPDIGVPFAHNWCQFQGLLYVYSAKGSLWRMTSDGAWDNTFANDIRELIQDLDPEDVVLGTHPNTMSLVLFYPGGSVSWNIQNGKWSPEQLTSDAGVSGDPISCATSQGDLYVTLDDSGTQTAYKWDSGATEMPVTALTNWIEHSNPASIEELLSTFDIDVQSTDKPIIFSIHRNGRLTYVRDASTTDNSNTITSTDAEWNSYSPGQYVCVFGNDIGGTGVDYLIGIIDSVSGNDIEIVNYSGNSVNAEATLSDCYMLIGQFIFTYDVNWTGKQQTPPLLQPYVTDCLSHSLGISILTNATSGRPFLLSASGTTSDIPASSTW